MITLLQNPFSVLRQDLRSKELRWLLAALVISVSALTSVGFLADRMHRAFEFDARQLLASDLLVVADQPISQDLIGHAHRLGLETAQTIVFPSMASSAAQSKLASIKAVSANYPLRGTLSIYPVGASPAKEVEQKQGPSPGTVWVEPAILRNLQIKQGDQLRLGDRQFLITGVLVREIDRGAGFMNFAPRVMMSLDDLPSTGLIGMGSRVTYRLLLSGSDNAVATYRSWVDQQIETQHLRGIHIETLENAQPMMRKTLERAEQFLSLVALLTAMICAVAIALSARRYAIGQADVCATWKCFGASRRTILKKQLTTMLLLGVLSAVIGSIVGFLAQETLTQLLGNLLITALPIPSLIPILWSAAFTWALLFAFAGPPLLSLSSVSPMRLIRNEFEFSGISMLWVFAFAFVSCAMLILLVARDWKLALWVGLSFIGALLIFLLCARTALWLVSKQSMRHFATRFAYTAMERRSGFAVMQITALAIAIMAILLIFLLRQDLLNAWRGNIPANAPNRFMINVQEDQKVELAKMIEASGAPKLDFYPMVRGRLVQVNGIYISPSSYSDENARRLVDREFNLSYTNQLPEGNRILSGEWISGDQPQISIESGIAKTLKLKLGDQLTYEVAGETVSAPITSIRKLDWSSMRVNFFVIMPPALLGTMPQSWITSYYQAPHLESLDFQISQAYPNVTMVDVSASLQQIQEVLNKLTTALGLLFVFTLLASMLVLMTAMAATQDERYRNADLLKAIGASQKTLKQIAMTELLVIGVAAGALAGIFAGLAAWCLGRYVMDIEFNAFVQAIALGLALGVGATMLAGYRFQKRIQGATAVQCLREC
ncbi:ABC transporter permease [Polynucleobacter sp. MWH-UH2A]|uniref:ABC transporter permease n=1 Tax=Polynucleobacter sp. MWH-UH2A TaxID=1855617 RepID=UPI001BFD9697|nr:FtsX-like permease family protein [Polynucleobacter sp. MWH-UH2A]QWD64938.1 ABC transporter permease [Polynucleobacter sp. MWH-UH2A]